MLKKKIKNGTKEYKKVMISGIMVPKNSPPSPEHCGFTRQKGLCSIYFYIICASISKIGHTIIASGHINRTTEMDQKS